MDIVKISQAVDREQISYMIAVYNWLRDRDQVAAATMCACDFDEYRRPVAYSFDLSHCDRTLATEFKLKWL